MTTMSLRSGGRSLNTVAGELVGIDGQIGSAGVRRFEGRKCSMGMASGLRRDGIRPARHNARFGAFCDLWSRIHAPCRQGYDRVKRYQGAVQLVVRMDETTAGGRRGCRTPASPGFEKRLRLYRRNESHTDETAPVSDG